MLPISKYLVDDSLESYRSIILSSIEISPISIIQSPLARVLSAKKTQFSKAESPLIIFSTNFKSSGFNLNIFFPLFLTIVFESSLILFKNSSGISFINKPTRSVVILIISSLIFFSRRFVSIKIFSSKALIRLLKFFNKISFSSVNFFCSVSTPSE